MYEDILFNFVLDKEELYIKHSIEQLIISKEKNF